MVKDDKKTKAREARQVIIGTDEYKKALELEAEMLAQKGVTSSHITLQAPLEGPWLDLTLDAAFVAQVPFIVGGIGL